MNCSSSFHSFFLPIYRTISSCLEFQSEIQIFNGKLYDVFKWKLDDMSIYSFNHLSNLDWILGDFWKFLSYRKKKTYILQFWKPFMCIQSDSRPVFTRIDFWEKKRWCRRKARTLKKLVIKKFRVTKMGL